MAKAERQPIPMQQMQNAAKNLHKGIYTFHVLSMHRGMKSSAFFIRITLQSQESLKFNLEPLATAAVQCVGISAH